MELQLTLDESKSLPLYRQLHDELRNAILSGRLGPGQKLPSSRALSRRMSLSRTTVALAYDQLETEGYVFGRRGSGTYVSTELLAGTMHAQQPAGEVGGPSSPHRLLRGPRGASDGGYSPMGRGASGSGRLPHDFHPGQAAWDAFPREVWRRLLARQWRTSWRDAMDYGDPAGYAPLREQVALYLARSRAVRCSPSQVVIVNGTQQALDLLSRLLLGPGDVVAVEDPGYVAARQVFASYHAHLVPLPVDSEGADVASLRGAGARLVLVAPSHQFPTGATMSLQRRLALLGWARSEGGLVVEDDYDSEFRFEGRPLPSLQGLDEAGNVIYLGSFSKVLFPALRVGYAVLPHDMVRPFEEAKELTDRQTPILEQQVLADFLREGHFDRHLRRMRELYGRRRRVLVESIESHMRGMVAVMGANAGMHIMVLLPDGVDEWDVARRAAEAGVGVYPASPCYCGPGGPPALVLGYAAMAEEVIRRGIATLARVVGDTRGG